jgi:hypothetical protein
MTDVFIDYILNQLKDKSIVIEVYGSLNSIAFNDGSLPGGKIHPPPDSGVRDREMSSMEPGE